jgi:hypothetical protein
VLDGKNALVNGTSYAVDVTEAAAEAAAVPAATSGTGVGNRWSRNFPGWSCASKNPPAPA